MGLAQVTPPLERHGYVEGISYTREYYAYQSPIAMAFAAASNGFPFPDLHRRFHYCDLGCGEGITTLVLAAAYPHAHFTGVDIDAAHIANATAMAEIAGLTNVSFIEASFDDPTLASLPQFDFVGAHGVYSWVSHPVRHQIRALVSRILKPAGLFYFCHFVKPGAYQTDILHALIRILFDDQPQEAAQERVVAAIKEARHLSKQSSSPLLKAYRQIDDDLDELDKRDRRFLMHEYGNERLSMEFFHEVQSDFNALGLHHVGSSRREFNGAKNRATSDITHDNRPLPWAQAEARASLLGRDDFRWDVFRKRVDGQMSDEPDRLRMDEFVIDSKVYPYRYSTTQYVNDREVSFDTDLFRSLVESAPLGRYTGAELRAQAAQNDDAFDDTLFDMVSTELFQPILKRTEPINISPDAHFTFTHPLSAALLERDLFSEGEITFPSEVLGGGLSVNGFGCLALNALDGETLSSAKPILQERLDGLTNEDRETLGLENVNFDRRWRHFTQSLLPRVVKYEIMRVSTR